MTSPGPAPHDDPSRDHLPTSNARPGYGPQPDSTAALPPWGQGGPPHLDQPHYGIGPLAAVQRAFAKYARFDGRASRGEYWWFALALTVAFLVIGVAAGLVGFATSPPGGGTLSPLGQVLVVVVGVIALVVFLVTLVPSISLTFRRLHDADLSGWFVLLNLIPYLGSFVLLVFAVLGPNPRGARFDRPPAPAAGHPYGG